MHRRHEAQAARRRRSRVWLPVIAACVGVLLAGCASPHARSPGPQPQPPQRQMLPADMGAWHAGALRIAQQRTGGESAFRLVAIEPRPTPKTLAADPLPVAPRAKAGPTAASVTSVAAAMEASPAPRAAPTRVREPVGSVYFPSAGSQVSTSGLPTVAAAIARAGRADRLVLTAYTDPYGPLDLNRRLADLRAESVATALTARGVEPAQLIVRSRPQCCATQPLPEREAAPYRRVDIEILTHRAVHAEERAHAPHPNS